MGKTKSKTSQTSAPIKEKNTIIELRRVLQTPGFTDECHDIFDPVIHGDSEIMAIRHSLFSKWKDPQKGIIYYKYNSSIGAYTNKLAAVVTRLANLAVPEVFPCPEIVMLCAQNYDENRKAIVNQNTQEEILSITESEFLTLLDLGLGFRTESSKEERIDLDKLAQAYDKLERCFQDSYIKGLIHSESTTSVTLDKDHKPPYQYDIFVPWVQNTISLLSFCLGLDSNKEVGASVLEMIYNIHCRGQSVEQVDVRYNFVQHIVESMQQQLLMIKQSTTTGKTKTFRFTSYLCYLLLAKHRPIFETENNKLGIEVYKFDERTQKKSETPSPVYEWTHKMRMTAANKNYNHFVDFFLAPIYQKIIGTSMPRFPVSCKDCIQLGSQIQLADWFFMEEYTLLRFYGSAVEPCKLPMHVTERVFTLEYVRQMESADELFSGQQKKTIFPSLPFAIGGLTFERKAFKLANELVTFFGFDFVSHWNYDPLNIIQTRLIANGNSASKYQHQEMPLIEKFKNKDSWDEVKKEMEKHATENNISMQELSSQIMTLHKSEPLTYLNFYKKASQPSTRSMPKEIKEACKAEMWCQTKMTDFWKMRQNLGEPKTSAVFDEIEEDEIFSNYWNKEHPTVLYDFGSDGDNERQKDLQSDADIQGIQDSGSTRGRDIVTLQMSDSIKQTYSRGATMIQKMGYAGLGPIGASGEGIWNPLPVPEPPKRGCKPIIGLSDNEDDSSRKGKKHYVSASEGHPKTLFVKSSNPVVVDPTGTGTGTGTSMDEPCAKKQKVMTITLPTMSAVTSPMYAPVASVQNPENNPKTPGFGMGHLQSVGNPQNKIVGGVSLTGVGGAHKDTTENSPFKHSILSANPDFSLNEFASKFEQTSERNRQIMKTLKSDAVAECQGSTNRIFPTYDPNNEMMNFMAVMPLGRDNIPPQNVINPNDIQVTSLQMDLSKVKNIDKINISKESNKMVYSTLLKAERENKRLTKQIEKLQADLDNVKAKEKAADNRFKDLQNRIKKSSPTEAIVQQEKMNEQVEKLTKELDECQKRLQDEQASSAQLFKSVESSAQVNNKLKTDLDYAVKGNNIFKTELENEKKQSMSRANMIFNLQKELGNEKKKEESSAKTINNLNKQLENMKQKEESTAKTISNLEKELENVKKTESSATANTNIIHQMRRELENAKKKEESATKKIFDLRKELENTKKEESTDSTQRLHDLKKELDNAKKKEESTAKAIHDLKRELGDEKKKEVTAAKTIQDLKKKLEDERKRATNLQGQVEEIHKKSEKEMSQMKKKMENVMAENRATSSEDHHVKDTIINMVKLIKQENWDKIMKNTDSLFEWLDLNSNIRLLFENVKSDFFGKRQIFTKSLKNLSDQILSKVKISSDRDLAKHGINSRLDASVMTIDVGHHCEQVTEMGEALKSVSKELKKMNNIILNFLNAGLPNPADSNARFIGNENYMKRLQESMNHDLGNLPEDTTPEGIASCIKPLSTMNEVVDKFLDSFKNISQKYLLLTRLQLFSYNLKQMEPPNDAEWSALKKFLEAGSSSETEAVTVAVIGSHDS